MTVDGSLVCFSDNQVAHEILALQIVEVLLSEPTNDSVEIAVSFIKEVGQLLEVSDISWPLSNGCCLHDDDSSGSSSSSLTNQWWSMWL